MPRGDTFCDLFPKPSTKAMARGRVPTTGKINAIVLAFKAAISPVGGTADKRAGNRHSPALCRRCTQAGVPPLHLFQGLNFFFPLGFY